MIPPNLFSKMVVRPNSVTESEAVETSTDLQGKSDSLWRKLTLAAAVVSTAIVSACGSADSAEMDTNDLPDSLADLPGAEGVDFAEVVDSQMIDQALSQLADRNPTAAGIAPFVDDTGDLNVGALKAMNWSNNDIKQAYLAFGIELLPLIEIALENLGHIVDTIGSSSGEVAAEIGSGGEAEIVEVSADENDAADSDSEEASLTLREQAINMALEEVPEAEPYIDEKGDFSVRDAVVEGGMTPTEARTLRAEWAEAYAEASRKVLHA